MTPKLARFIDEALRRALLDLRRNGMPADLQQELARFHAEHIHPALAFVPGDDSKRQEATPVAGPSGPPDSGAVTPQGDPLAIGLTEAAKALGLSHRTVQRLVASGDLRSTKIGRRRVISRADLEQMLEAS